MAKNKKQRTPEQIAKLNKKLFRYFIAAVFLVCIVLGITNGVKSVNFSSLTDLSAFNQLKNNSCSISDVLSSTGLENKYIVNYDIDDLISTLDASGIDYFTDNTIDNAKWDTPIQANNNYTLTDIMVCQLVNQFYTNVKAISIQLDSGNKYAVTILEYINFSNIVENKELRGILPATAYATTKCVIKVQSNAIVVESSKIIAYNTLNESKSDVITATINTSSTDLNNYSTKHFTSIINTLCTNTNTNISLSGSSIVFSI